MFQFDHELKYRNFYLLILFYLHISLSFTGYPPPKIWWTVNEQIVPTVRKKSHENQRTNPSTSKLLNSDPSIGADDSSQRPTSINSIRHRSKSDKLLRGSSIKDHNYILHTGIFRMMPHLEFAHDHPYGAISSSTDTDANLTRSLVSVKDLTAAYDAADISCWVANSNLSRPLHAAVKVEVYSKFKISSSHNCSSMSKVCMCLISRGPQEKILRRDSKSRQI